jgi:hypothetical protein
LRRAVSHESIMSLSNGLDIHTLKSRPTQLALRHLATATADTGVSAVIARPTISRAVGEGKRGSVLLRDNLAITSLGSPIPRTRDSSRTASSTSANGSVRRLSPQPRLASSGTRALGKLVSWRPWGGGSTSSPTLVIEDAASVSEASGLENAAVPTPTPAPTLIPQPTDPQALSPPQGSRLSVSPNQSSRMSSPRERDFPRAPGINQPGAIPGFYEYWAAHQRRGPPSKVYPDAVDRDALRDGLGDE